MMVELHEHPFCITVYLYCKPSQTSPHIALVKGSLDSLVLVNPKETLMKPCRWNLNTPSDETSYPQGPFPIYGSARYNGGSRYICNVFFHWLRPFSGVYRETTHGSRCLRILDENMIVSLWNFTGVSAAVLPRRRSNITAIHYFKNSIATSRYGEIAFVITQGPTLYATLKTLLLLLIRWSNLDLLSRPHYFAPVPIPVQANHILWHPINGLPPKRNWWSLHWTRSDVVCCKI